jgi:hypothetical protein
VEISIAPGQLLFVTTVLKCMTRITLIVLTEIQLKGRIEMAKWRKDESMSHAIGREGAGIAKGVGKELLSFATLGLYKPSRRASMITIRYPDGKGENTTLICEPVWDVTVPSKLDSIAAGGVDQRIEAYESRYLRQQMNWLV